MRFESQPISTRAAFAQSILYEYIKKKSGQSELPDLQLTPEKGISDDEPVPDPAYTGRICIVGAGACGLYLAMMLKYLGFSNVDILEASDRVGGRCFTYPKPGDTGTHSYYDIGAMRIPDIPWMEHVLKFTREALGLADKVVPYIYTSDEKPGPPVCYNFKNEPVKDPAFREIMDTFMSEYNFMNDFNGAFAKWMDPTKPPLKDNYSTRAWLMIEKNWSYKKIANAELSDTSTGLFDQSLTETLIDYADFAAADSKKWYRVDGGMQTVTDTMADLLASDTWPSKSNFHPSPGPSPNLQTSTQVTAMSYSFDHKSKPCIKVTTTSPYSQHKPKVTNYDMVFNTTAMGPLQRMDLSKLPLPDDVHTGIRTLSYDRATKVVIKFSHPWWFKNPDKTQIFGGVSSSDLPISNVVYPSWNDGPDKPAVLMVSYSWAQDATRMGSLVKDFSMPGVKPSKDDEIVKLCLRNLVTLWAGTEESPSYEDLLGWVVDDGSDCAPYHAWAWSHDPYTGGAFALFGPGQFQNVYPAFQGLHVGGHIAFCGEALSAHHAWISGAWASAYMQLMHFLEDRKQLDAVRMLKESPFGGSDGSTKPRQGDDGEKYRDGDDMDEGPDDGEGETGGYPHPEEMDESLLLNLLKLRQKEWKS
ncbi:L-amino acid oxidase [Rhypophila sp. PSN 637]